MLLLTQCAACAAPLGFSSGKKCGRCQTRYCGPACQEQHWKEGGHDQLCKKIKKAGGAEQYNANEKYAEAVAVAAEACADDTKGQTCYICTQALHWKTKEGLVRGCACRGTAGFAHVSCLAEQAKILFAEVEGTNLGLKVINERWFRWATCSLCEQRYHGVVWCALGWACWKTYMGRPVTDETRIASIEQLGHGLSEAGYHEDALSVYEAEVSMRRCSGESEVAILGAQSNIASVYDRLGRLEEALRLRQYVYRGQLRYRGEEHRLTLTEAFNYANDLTDSRRFEEAKTLLHRHMPVARRVLGASSEVTLKLRRAYAMALCRDNGATLDDLREAVNMLEELERAAWRVFGRAHPFVAAFEACLRAARAVLRAREATGDVESIREGVDAL